MSSQEEQQLSRIPNKKGKRGVEQARCWMLTLNMAHGKSDPKDFDEKDTIAVRRFNAAAQVPPCTYCIFQGECGKEGTYHIQGYAEFEKPLTAFGVRKHFGERVYCEIRAGTQQQAIDYCSKDDESKRSETKIYGEPMKPNVNGGTKGSRSDWRGALDMLKDNKLPIDVVEVYPHMVPCVRALVHTRTEILRPISRHRKTEATVLWGSPDSGKSTTAFEMARKNGSFYNLMANGNGLWWDGYDPLIHQTVVIDEFTGGKCPLTFLNMMLDKHPMQVECKGGSYPFLAKRVIITSNYHPKSWYDFENPEKRLCWPALLRRLDNIVHFDIRETAISHGSGTRSELWVEVAKGIFNVHNVQSRWPIHSIQDDSDLSSGQDDLQDLTPVPLTGSMKSIRGRQVRRQDAMDGLDSALNATVVDDSDDE